MLIRESCNSCPITLRSHQEYKRDLHVLLLMQHQPTISASLAIIYTLMGYLLEAHLHRILLNSVSWSNQSLYSILCF